jgi:hypothetical protein
MITISITSTQAARKVVTKTEEWLTATFLSRSSLQILGGRCSWVAALALQLLGAGDVRVSGVSWKHRFLPPAPASVCRPALLGDPHLPHPAPSEGWVSVEFLLSRMALERPGVFPASTRLRSRRAAIPRYRPAGKRVTDWTGYLALSCTNSIQSHAVSPWNHRQWPDKRFPQRQVQKT